MARGWYAAAERRHLVRCLCSFRPVPKRCVPSPTTNGGDSVSSSGARPPCARSQPMRRGSMRRHRTARLRSIAVCVRCAASVSGRRPSCRTTSPETPTRCPSETGTFRVMSVSRLVGEHRADDARMLELLEPYRPHRARVWRWIVAGVAGPPRRAARAPVVGLLRQEARRRPAW